MKLETKRPTSIPELKASHVSVIASRLAGQRPLGMFRLSDIEFLLCYEGKHSIPHYHPFEIII